MKTVRLSRQNFPNTGMCSYFTYYEYLLSKRYNVVIDSENPDIIITTNLRSDPREIDIITGKLPTNFTPKDNPNIKFLYVTGEVSDFVGCLAHNNQYALGYAKKDHERYFRQPACAIDVWGIFKESRMSDTPRGWLTERRDFEAIKKRNKGFCSVIQNSHCPVREKVFNKLSEYKKISAAGPWKYNMDDGIDHTMKSEYSHKSIYNGRRDGLTYKKKIEFQGKYKFNMCMYFQGNHPYMILEKPIHTYYSGSIPIFYGNDRLSEDGFNPDTFINLHNYDINGNLNDLLEVIKEIDNDEKRWKKMIEEPIFIDNKPPSYYEEEVILEFLSKIVEA